MEPQQQQQPPQIPADATMTVPTQIAASAAAPAREPLYIGLIIGALIILLILVLGGLYLWGSTALLGTWHADIQEDTAPAVTTASSTDELRALEAELDADLAGLSNDFADLDAAFVAESETTATSNVQ